MNTICGIRSVLLMAILTLVFGCAGPSISSQYRLGFVPNNLPVSRPVVIVADNQFSYLHGDPTACGPR